MKIRLLSAADVVRALPMAEAIEGMKQAFASLSLGQATVPLRSRIDVPNRGATLVMPGTIQGGQTIAIKTVSVFPGNTQSGLPAIHALVTVINSDTGEPIALLEGGSLTAIRTGAASGAATDLLSRQDAQSVAIFGCGVQARTQLEAVCTVRKIKHVRVFSLNPDHAAEFASKMSGKGPIPDDIIVAENADEAIVGVDVICTATTSSKPVFKGALLQPGMHINGIGSFIPSMQEVDAETVKRSLVFVDSRPAVWEEAGDLIIPLHDGDITADHIHAELGEIVSGEQPGRESAEQITFFKSVGIAVQDVAAASIALNNAQDHDLGTTITL